MGVERTSGLKLMQLLPLAGLLSGLYSTCFIDSLFVLLSGAVFGAVTAVCLMKCGIFNERQAGWFIGVATAAFLLSFSVALGVELALARSWALFIFPVSPISLFAGGVVGGFVILGAALFLLRAGIGGRALAAKALSWSVLGGLLAVIGWALGPSLGVAISHLLHAAHWPLAPSPRPGDSSIVEYSVCVVWQTGMAFVLGIVVHPTMRNLGHRN